MNQFCNSIYWTVLFCLTFLANAVGQNEYEWASTYNGTQKDYDYGYSVTVDNNNIPFATGYTTGNDNSKDIVTHKYDPGNGTIVWTKVYKGSKVGGTDIATQIITDDSGYVYVAGSVTNDSTDLDFVTIKYHSNGDEVWSRSYNYDSNSVDGAQSIDVDPDGNVYVAGLSKHTDSLSIVVKYNSSGDTVWTYKFQGMEPGWNETVKVQFVGEELFVVGSSGRGAHIAKLNTSTGEEIWAKFQYKSIGNSNKNDRILDMIVSEEKNIYFTGDYIISDSIGGTESRLYVAAYDSGGNELWFRDYPDNSDGWNIDLDDSSNIYVCGEYNSGNDELNNYITIRYDKSGNQKWVRTYNGHYDGIGVSNDYARRIVVKNSDVFVSGNAVNTINGIYTVGITTLKYDTDGNLKWISSYHNESSLLSICGDNQGNAYVAGMDIETLDFLVLKYGLKTSIEDLLESVKASVYPNPTQGLLRIEGLDPTISKFRVFDPVGRIVYQNHIQNEGLFNTEFLEKGMYVIQFLNNNSEFIYQTKITKI